LLLHWIRMQLRPNCTSADTPTMLSRLVREAQWLLLYAPYLRCSTALLVGGSRDRFPVVSLGIFSEATGGTMCSCLVSGRVPTFRRNVSTPNTPMMEATCSLETLVTCRNRESGTLKVTSRPRRWKYYVSPTPC
jgi:hypothetical protein